MAANAIVAVSTLCLLVILIANLSSIKVGGTPLEFQMTDERYLTQRADRQLEYSSYVLNAEAS